MEKIPVQSSTIMAIAYDEDSQTLEIDFLSGTCYQYFDVPAVTAREFIDTPIEGSHGKHLAKNIKGVYRYAKV